MDLAVVPPADLAGGACGGLARALRLRSNCVHCSRAVQRAEGGEGASRDDPAAAAQLRTAARIAVGHMCWATRRGHSPVRARSPALATWRCRLHSHSEGAGEEM